MQLEVNGSVIDAPLNNELIEQAIFALDGDSDSFVILSRDRMTYIQVAGDARSGFLLEYQEGSLDKHYSCAELDLGTSDVIEAFQRYLAGDSRWKSDLVWTHDEASGAIPAGRTWTTIVIVIAIVIAVIVWLAIA